MVLNKGNPYLTFPDREKTIGQRSYEDFFIYEKFFEFQKYKSPSFGGGGRHKKKPPGTSVPGGKKPKIN